MMICRISAPLMGLLLLAAATTSRADPYSAGISAFASGDYAGALKLLRPLAEQGDFKAMNVVGGIYVGGFGVEKDCAKGTPMVLRAAQAGYARAQYDMGRFYATGTCVPASPRESLAWHLKAAKQHDPDAAFAAGLGYAEGASGRMDLGEAYCWFRASLKFFDEAYPKASIDNGSPWLRNKQAAEKNVGVLRNMLSGAQRERGDKLLCIG